MRQSKPKGSRMGVRRREPFQQEEDSLLLYFSVQKFFDLRNRSCFLIWGLCTGASTTAGFTIQRSNESSPSSNFPRKLRPDLGQYRSEWPNMTANERRSRRPLQLEELKP